MIKFNKLHDLAAYLKQVARIYLQYDYELLYQKLRARYVQQAHRGSSAAKDKRHEVSH